MKRAKRNAENVNVGGTVSLRDGYKKEMIFEDLLEGEEDLEIIMKDLKNLLKKTENKDNLHVEVWRESKQAARKAS